MSAIPEDPIDRGELDERLALVRQLAAAQRAIVQRPATIATLRRRLRSTPLGPEAGPRRYPKGLRRTYRDGPPPVPPPARGAIALSGRHLRYAIVAVLARAGGGPLDLEEIHRRLHLDGYYVHGHSPVKYLADAAGYEHRVGRLRRVARGRYTLGTIAPRRRRRALSEFPIRVAAGR